MEAEECMTRVYSKTLFLKNIGVHICGFTATKSSTLPIYREVLDKTQLSFVKQANKLTREKKITKFINKGQLFDIFLPTVFEYDMKQGIEDGLLSPFETIIIKHDLSTNKSKIPVKITKNWNIGSEQEYWNYWLKLSNNQTVEWSFRSIIKQRFLPKFLFDLQSKIIIGKKLLSLLKNRKTLIFGHKLDWLEKITTNVAKDNVLELLKDFDNGVINTIASSKRLKRGITIPGLNTLVVFLDGKSNTNLIQKLGRIIRYEYKKVGKVYIIVVKDTYEERWLEESLKVKDFKNDTTSILNLNIVKTINSKELWRQ